MGLAKCIYSFPHARMNKIASAIKHLVVWKWVEILLTLYIDTFYVYFHMDDDAIMYRWHSIMMSRDDSLSGDINRCMNYQIWDILHWPVWKAHVSWHNAYSIEGREIQVSRAIVQLIAWLAYWVYIKWENMHCSETYVKNNFTTYTYFYNNDFYPLGWLYTWMFDNQCICVTIWCI